MNIEKEMKFINNLNKETFIIINIIDNKVEYNFIKNPSKISYFCTLNEFKEWIKKVNAILIK